MKRFFWFILVPYFLWAQYERPGSAGGQFLVIDVSPRAAAMAGAYLSVTNGAEAVYYNPAAIVYIPNLALSATHTQWFAGINSEFVSAVINMDGIGSFGLIFTSLMTDEMQVRTPLQPDGTGETFYSAYYRFGIAYGRKLTNHVSFGGTINYIYGSLYKEFNASAVSADIAVLYVTNFHGFRFGMKIEHFGSEMKYINESYPLPTNFQFGLSMNAWDTEDYAILVSGRAIKPNVGKPLGSIGLELKLLKHIFVRGGYQINSDVQTFSFGAGLQWQVLNQDFTFDYSYSDYSLLGGTHRFGLNYMMN